VSKTSRKICGNCGFRDQCTDNPDRCIVKQQNGELPSLPTYVQAHYAILPEEIVLGENQKKEET